MRHREDGGYKGQKANWSNKSSQGWVKDPGGEAMSVCPSVQPQRIGVNIGFDVEL